MTIYFTVI